MTRVLVADDHAAYRSSVVRALERTGLEVVSAALLAGVHGYLSRDASRAAIVLALSAAADA